MEQKREIGGALRTVRITGCFWGGILERNRTATLPQFLKQCEENGHIRNLEIAAGQSEADYSGESDRDSDLFKVVEGMAYCLVLSPDVELEACLDTLIEKIAAAQEPDGYLNSYFTSQCPGKRHTDQHRFHELYCAGHLIEAAVAHFEATGKRTLLDVAVKLADHIDSTFGPGKLETVPGHPEVELALVRLYNVTRKKRYLDLCRYFVDMRGNGERVHREYAGKPVIESERHPGRNRPPEYRQDHLPPVDQRKPVGHAVCAGYLYAAMTDIALECGSKEHAIAVDALWNNIVGKHLYITGGIGTHQHHDEGFGDEYLLPNDTAYCETCAGIAFLLFCHRLNRLNGDAHYADMIETILYNHLLASTDLAGCKVFYRNPLASDGTRRRYPWDAPPCCPTNVVRILPQIARYIYATNGKALYVDQFVNSTADLTLDSGRIGILQETRYPWDGRITITLQPEAPQEIDLHIRIPAWVEGRPVPSDLYTTRDAQNLGFTINVNGEACDTGSRTKGYCVIRRTWQHGDCVTLDFPMPVRRVLAHEKVEADRNRVALMRGPLLYCLEGTDHDADLDDVMLDPEARLSAEHVQDLLGGVTVIKETAGPLKAMPYYAWNNREAGKMAVWIKTVTRESTQQRSAEG